MSPQTHVESDARTVGTIMYRTTEQLEVPYRLHRAKEVKVLLRSLLRAAGVCLRGVSISCPLRTSHRRAGRASLGGRIMRRCVPRWPYAVTPGKATRTCRGCAHGLALVLSALVDVHDEINVQHAWPVLIRDLVRYQASDMHRAVVPPAARRQPNEFPWAQRHGQQRIVQTVLFRPTDSCARSLLSSSNS